MSRFDEGRIQRGEVTPKEKSELETTLLTQFLKRARDLGTRVQFISDKQQYAALRENGNVFQDNKFIIYLQGGHVVDMAPIAHRLVDTDEGNFYAKLMLHDECLQP